MKKVILSALTFLMLLGFAGCADLTGNENDNPITVRGYQIEVHGS